ncbi:hypothetical protein [Corynebacterium choanae]|nr:hypothetical protein [Corynebacterium choanae]
MLLKTTLHQRAVGVFPAVLWLVVPPGVPAYRVSSGILQPTHMYLIVES